MSVVAVISNRTGFDVELRAALGPEGPDVGQIPVGPTASERMIVEALPASGDVVVLVGPDLPQDQALGLLELVSQMRPTAAPVLVAHPSPDVLRQLEAATRPGTLDGLGRRRGDAMKRRGASLTPLGPPRGRGRSGARASPAAR